MKRLMLALLVSVPFSAHAQNVKIRYWPDSPIPVAQWIKPDGHQFCTFDLVSGTGLFKVTKFDNGTVDIMIARNGGWTSGGNVNFSIDGRAYSVTMTLRTIVNGVLTATLNDAGGRDFLHDLDTEDTLNCLWTCKRDILARRDRQHHHRTNRCAASITAERGAIPAPLAPYVVPTTVPATTRGEALIVADNNGSLTVNGIINGAITVTFTLDSGAALVALPNRLGIALFNNGTLTQADYMEFSFTMANQQEERQPKYRLKSITVGGRTAINVICTIISSDQSPILLGQSFLSNFTSWSINNARGCTCSGMKNKQPNARRPGNRCIGVTDPSNVVIRIDEVKARCRLHGLRRVHSLCEPDYLVCRQWSLPGFSSCGRRRPSARRQTSVAAKDCLLQPEPHFASGNYAVRQPNA